MAKPGTNSKTRLDIMATCALVSFPSRPSTMITAPLGDWLSCPHQSTYQWHWMMSYTTTQTVPLGWPVENTHTTQRQPQPQPKILCK